MNKKTFDTVSDWLDYFEQLHAVGIDMGLERVSAVWSQLCDAYDISHIATDSVITVSGTNGKGSTCQMLSLLLQADNKRVGMYTSPHIHHFRERVQINGQPVDDALLVRAFAAIETHRGDISLSYFEATTLVGLLVFAWEGVDYAVLEVGLGGRLDAINIIDADAAIMTSVGLDHQAFLGSDVAQIAVEKAGVFRAGKPAVYAQPHVYPSVLDYAQQHRIPLLVCGVDYQQTHVDISYQGNTYQLPESLLDWGVHQLQNAAAVVVLLARLQRLPADYHQRLRQFSVPGRLQVIAENPRVIVDVAHNTDAATALAQHIRQQNHQAQVIAVIGMLSDKDHAAVLSLFDGIFDTVYFADTTGERGYRGADLQAVWQQCSETPSVVCEELGQCLSTAIAAADNEDVIYAFGSFLVAAALIEDSSN